MPTPLGARRGPTYVQVRSLWRVYEDYQMKQKLILIGGVVTSAIVSVTVLWWAWSLVVALVEVL
jgi:hypothetical protein